MSTNRFEVEESRAVPGTFFVTDNQKKVDIGSAKNGSKFLFNGIICTTHRRENAEQIAEGLNLVSAGYKLKSPDSDPKAPSPPR